MRVLPGDPHRLGATWDGEGVNFSLFSANATRVELCLFDSSEDAHETDRVELPERTSDVWHGRIPGLRPGQLYGYRVHGPWAPEEGHRFNPSKLLIDPYARALHRPLFWDESLLGHDPKDLNSPNSEDSSPFVPRGVVAASHHDWGDDRPPRTPWSQSLLYETHVKGLTMRHPEVPEQDRGRYTGLTAAPVVEHLKALGVTAVELLPVHHAGTEEHLARSGLTNYWGYATLGFFAPDARFSRSSAPAAAVGEFRAMVRALHDAGIEVILDVVYNHTPEGGPLGPTISFRGIDNATYYRLQEGDPSSYRDFTGTGHTLDTSHPRVRQLVLDSLRYWVDEMHVDGFRFDLAPAIARDHGTFDPNDRFFEIVRQDPVLSRVKLIAEPWDLGPDGYRLGGFPPGWSEWNDRFRDVARRFWRGDAGQVGEIASRISGSSDIFSGEQGPNASVNYVCSHDGFTMRDLVSYAHKHNEDNGESGRDGPHEDSHNWGVEGPSRNRRVVRMRDRTRRNLTATVALACGVPMWLGGDELGRSQKGNNNTYCQDNELSWYDWALDESDADFLEFVQYCFALRRRNAAFTRQRHLSDAESEALAWLRPDASPMRPADWQNPETRALALRIDEASTSQEDEQGQPLETRTAMLLLNADALTRSFRLAPPGTGRFWHEVLNTACPLGDCRPRKDHVRLAPHSLVLLEAEFDS